MSRLFIPLIVAVHCSGWADQDEWTRVTKFGASESKTAIENQEAIQAAFDASARVVIDGRFDTEPLEFNPGQHIFCPSPADGLNLRYSKPPQIRKGGNCLLMPKNWNTGATKDVTIQGGTFDGGRDTEDWSQVSGQGQHVIATWGSQNIRLIDLTIRNAYSDGIYVHGVHKSSADQAHNSEDIVIRGCRIDRAGRNGISVVSGVRGIITDCIITNVDRTSPKVGIDLEPNGGQLHPVSDWVISNTIMADCGGGIHVSNVSEQLPNTIVNISNVSILRHTALYGLQVGTNARVRASGIVIDSPVSTNWAVNVNYSGRLELRDSVIRGAARGIMAGDSLSGPVESSTNTDPVVLTLPVGHGRLVGNRLLLKGVEGQEELNDRIHRVLARTDTTVTLETDGSSHSGPGSGGSWTEAAECLVANTSIVDLNPSGEAGGHHGRALISQSACRTRFDHVRVSAHPAGQTLFSVLDDSRAILDHVENENDHERPLFEIFGDLEATRFIDRGQGPIAKANRPGALRGSDCSWHGWHTHEGGMLAMRYRRQVRVVGGTIALDALNQFEGNEVRIWNASGNLITIGTENGATIKGGAEVEDGEIAEFVVDEGSFHRVR